MSLKSKFERYTVAEWFLLLVGAVVLSIQVYRYATDSLADNTMELAVFAISFCLVIAPKAIIGFIKAARGIGSDKEE